MAFWRKGEDPWDRDPEQRRSPRAEESRERPGEGVPGLLDQLKDWRERRKGAREEPEAPPMACPWCGKDMERGYLYPTNGREIWWLRKKLDLRAKLIGPDPKTSLLVSDEGGLHTYKTAWHCEACQKMVLDAQGLRPPGEMDIPPFQQTADGETEETTEGKEQ